ncbi:uncharacterized protein METZ01_LOCUS387883, partial [marine metagenome]
SYPGCRDRASATTGRTDSDPASQGAYRWRCSM